MAAVNLKKPFFMFNPKSYLYGEKLLELAKIADTLAEEYADTMSIFVTAPFTDLAKIKASTAHIIVTAQHMDGMELGRGMGHIPPESLVHAGAGAVFLNHAEHPLTLSQLVKAVARAKELGLISVVCADSLMEATLIAHLEPEIILCEPTELIGTGETSDASYIEKTNAAIRGVSSDILVMQAAGISTADDVYRTISLGADGTGCTSGIVKAEDSKTMLKDMIHACAKAYKEGNDGAQ